MKNTIILVSILLLVSCKSKMVVVQTKKDTTNISITADKLIENYYNNKTDFSTLYIKSNAHYQDSKQSQNVTAEIKIKQNEKILVSIRFLGITMAKALITPKEVRYYEKINGSYFEGDFSSLSKWLGTDLDYDKIQNLLLGQSIDNLKKGKYNLTVLDKIFKLDEIQKGTIKKIFYINSENTTVQKQEITQPEQDRSIQIVYSDSKNYNELLLPSNISIQAFQKENKTEINLDYNTITLNEELSFPYQVPDGYKKIIIK